MATQMANARDGRNGGGPEQHRQHRQIHDHARGPDQAGSGRAGQVLEAVVRQARHVNQVVELLAKVELALPQPAVLKADRDLADMPAAALDQELQADLVADRVDLVRLPVGLAPERKEARHRIPDPGERPRQQRGDPRVQPAQEAPPLVGLSPAT